MPAPGASSCRLAHRNASVATGFCKVTQQKSEQLIGSVTEDSGNQAKMIMQQKQIDL